MNKKSDREKGENSLSDKERVEIQMHHTFKYGKKTIKSVWLEIKYQIYFLIFIAVLYSGYFERLAEWLREMIK